MTGEKLPRFDENPRAWFMGTFRFTWIAVPIHLRS
jgi:hypothetical protein